MSITATDKPPWERAGQIRPQCKPSQRRAQRFIHQGLPPPISWDSRHRLRHTARLPPVRISLPRKLIGANTVIHSRRPEAWANLSKTDAALLDFLRQRGKASELSPADTVRRTLTLASEQVRFERLLNVADSEPPRVRAMLGAIGQQLGKNPAALLRLRESLNPFSRFDFGMLAGLKYARQWQAKERR